MIEVEIERLLSAIAAICIANAGRLLADLFRPRVERGETLPRAEVRR